MQSIHSLPPCTASTRGTWCLTNDSVGDISRPEVANSVTDTTTASAAITRTIDTLSSLSFDEKRSLFVLDTTHSTGAHVSDLALSDDNAALCADAIFDATDNSKSHYGDEDPTDMFDEVTGSSPRALVASSSPSVTLCRPITLTPRPARKHGLCPLWSTPRSSAGLCTLIVCPMSPR